MPLPTHDPLKDSAGSPTSSTAEKTAQDLQRAALDELVQLSKRCAAREVEIESRRKTALSDNEKHFTTANDGIQRRFLDYQDSLRQKHEVALARIEGQYQSDIEKLGTVQDAARVRLEGEAENINREVKKKFAQAAWLADSVFEGTQNQLREETRQNKERYAGRVKALDELEGQAAALAYNYGSRWPEPGPRAEVQSAADSAASGAVASAPRGGRSGDESDPAAVRDSLLGSPDTARYERGRSAMAGLNFTELCNLAGNQLAELAAMRLPKLVVGPVPFLIGFLLCAAAAGIAQAATGTMIPNWVAMGVAAGATLLVTAVAATMLKLRARGRVEAIVTTLRVCLDHAHWAAQSEYDTTCKSLDERHAASVKRRASEVQSAKDQYAPTLGRAAHGRETAMKSLEEDRSRIVPRIEENRERSLKELEEWQQRSRQELEAGHAQETQAAREKYEARRAEIEREYEEAASALEADWQDGLTRIQAPIHDGARSERTFPEWSDPVWTNWKPPREFGSAVRVGELQVDLKEVTQTVPQQLSLPESFRVPALLAFPRQASLMVHSDHTGRAAAISTLQTVMLRLLTSVPPGRVRFTIIDPVGLGQNFAGFMHLADHDENLVGNRIWTDSEHIDRVLADLTEHMETVIQKYLRNEFETIDAYNAQAGELAEPYRFLVISDFPVGFSEEAIRRLSSIATTGARCGVYTLIARDTRRALPAGTHLDEISTRSVNFVQQNGRFVWDDPVFRRFPLTLDSPPPEDFLTRILHIVGRYARELRRVEVPFDTITPSAERMWSGDTSSALEVPIGRMGATRLQTLRLGRGVAQHALIGGKTGSGKSTLLHVLITNLAMWYSPDEVEFYLVDFKKGVEFKAYAEHALPHARAIAVESDREFGLSVLQRVDAELGRRGALFRKLGVQDLQAYREASGERMPRTLLIIDEFQEFFSEDDRLAQEAGLLLDRLVRQGRAFGVHVLLGSQTIGGTSGLARSTIGQMAVRIALQTSEADSHVILGDGNTAARLLSRPGEAIYNDAGGLVEANSPFQVAWLSDETRDAFLGRVSARAGSDGNGREPAVVFEGNVPADISKNDPLTRMLEAPTWPAGGAPRAWLGEPVAIKEPTAVIMRRQSGANVLVVGQQEEPALALMSAAMLTLAAQHRTDRAIFHVFDGTPADSPLAQVFPRLKANVPHEVRLVPYREAAEGVGVLAAEMQRRQGIDPAGEPSIFVLVYGLQRYRVLRKQEDSFSFSSDDKPASADRQFADLLREGPPLGMHVLTWSDTPAAVERTFDRASLREFDYRVLFQMSATDSSNLIDSPLANKLGMHRALAYSEEQGTLEKFRPYALPDAAWLEAYRAKLAAKH